MWWHAVLVAALLAVQIYCFIGENGIPGQYDGFGTLQKIRKMSSGESKIPIRPLGSQGLKSSIQGLGCMGMSAFYKDTDHTATEEESVKVINRARELGVSLLDTSDVYGPYTNEELVGRAVKGARDKFTIATKFALAVKDGRVVIDCSPEYIAQACEGSLKRLGIEHIDLYYMHRVDPKVPIEETAGAMKKLVEAGKVKYLGLSEVSAADIRRAHKVHPITAVQLEWSLWSRDVEAEVVPTCRELGIGIVAYSPLGRGFLGGKYRDRSKFAAGDFREGQPRFQDENFKKNLEMLGKLDELAAKKGVTVGQLSLAWVHHQGPDVFPIPGTKRLSYLEENAKAATIKLTSEEMKLLEDAVPASKVVGDRYNEGGMKSTHVHAQSKAA